MTGLHKNSLKTISSTFVTLTFCIVVTWNSEARHIRTSEIYSTLTSDTIPPRTKPVVTADSTARRDYRNPGGTTTVPGLGAPPDTLPRQSVRDTGGKPGDTLRIGRDTTVSTLDTFSVRMSKDTLDAPVDYEAEDSAVLLVRDKKFILYGKTRTKYNDIELTAPKVIMDQQTNLLTAVHHLDSATNAITRAKFTQGDQAFESDTIVYNFKTQKGITRNTYTQQDELYIKAGTSKRIDANTYFIREGYFTTCNLDDPHFAFKTNKLKVINNKVAVSGPTHPEFEGVPVPIWLPFGYYPMKKGRHSGILAPQFTATEQFGLGLTGLGYYHVLNDYVDVTVQGDIYSYGGWAATLRPTYRKRYRYQGGFNINLMRSKVNFKGDPDFQLNKTFQVTWTHSVDQKARPGTSFSANVNAGSTRHNRLLPNSPERNFQNQMGSSISYSKTWAGKPYNLNLTANHSQNNNSGDIYINLPTAAFTVSTLYPFEKENRIGAAKWYEKVGIGYSGSFQNQINFRDDSSFTIKKLFDTLQWGATHRFPINLQLPPIAGGNILIGPSVSYEERWLTNKLTRRYNNVTKRVDTLSLNEGFFTDRNLSLGLSFNTALYGTYLFKNAKLSAIRHVMRPTLTMSYKPNLSKKYYQVMQIDTFGNKMALPMFASNMFSGFPYGRYGGMFFGIDNNLEAKWRGKKDTVDRKIRLIDGFGVSSGYNFLQDSMKLQPFNIYLRSTLFEKINISATALLDPYDVNNRGIQVNRFVWEGDRFRLPRLTSGSVSISTNFQSKRREGADSNEDAQAPPEISDPTLLGDQQRLQDYMRRNPAEFVDFNVPWSIDLSYSLTFSRRLKADYSGFESFVSSSVNFRNSFSLTPKWNFTTSGYYDFDTKQLTSFNLSVNRDLHCWQMSVNVIPIGLFRSFNITISPKSSLLQDLRVNRTRVFSDY
jgi:hypothetical protein